MIAPSVKEKQKKKMIKTYLIIGGIAYLYFALATLHYAAISASDKRAGMSEKINRAMSAVFTSERISPSPRSTGASILSMM